MGLIELIYITDDRDKLLFQYLTSLSTPTFNYVQTRLDQLKLAQQQYSTQDGVQGFQQAEKLLLDPVIEIDKKTVVLYYQYQDFWFYVVGSLENEVSRYEDIESSSEEESSEESSEEEEEEGEEEEDTVVDEVKEEITSTNSDKPEKESVIVSPIPKVNPLITIEFIKQFIIVLESYISNPISATTLTKKYDTVNILLQNMIDFQYPFVTDLNQLRELATKDSIINKLMSQTRNLSTNATAEITRNSSSSSVNSSHSINNNGKKLSVLESNNKIPWRKSNVKYSINEMFVDIIETLNVIIPPQTTTVTKEQTYSSAFYNPNTIHKQMKPIVATINGQLQFTSHLSGIPDLELKLDVGRHNLGIPSFHPCVRINKWQQTQDTLSFIPADGKFELMNYEIDLLNNDKYGVNLNEILRYLGLVDITFKTGLGTLKNEFEIKLNLQMLKQVKFIDELKIDIFIKEEESIKTLKLTNGDLLKKSSTNYQWIFDKSLSLGSSPMFQGAISSSSQPEYLHDQVSSIAPTSKFKTRAPIFIKLNYSNKGSLASGMKISNLQILSAKGLGESVKPYKGVKYTTQTGDFILR